MLQQICDIYLAYEHILTATSDRVDYRRRNMRPPKGLDRNFQLMH